MQMYNFLDSKLLPKVSTESASLENYEVSNLISDNFLIKSRGFIAFTTVKPPVDIDFELLCPISLLYITLSTTVGTQKSTGIEILARNASSSYISICRAFFNEPGVVFCNSRFYSKDFRPDNTNNDYHLAFFKANTFRTFINVSNLKVRIFQTERTVPCIGAVEIWGRIAKSCSNTTVCTINKILNVKNTIINDKISHLTEKDYTKEFEIPDEFKDALTFEVMAMPMTLPSGHTIDQSTLEKCLSNNASYGRQGCDPFTGLSFTETRKPVLNVSLKTRIDMFLVQNSNQPETFSLKRTSGKLTNVSYCNKGVIQPKRIKLDESDTNDSLNEALSKAIKSDNFICFTKDSKEICDMTNMCNLCSNTDHLYKLPCKHLCCKKCLLDMDNHLECKDCICKFQKNELQKFHL